jgi:hypothetical protein
MNRTLRAYDLVTTYALDCPSGTRWTTKDIAELRTEGIHLHDDVRALRDWQRKVAQDGDLGEATMNRIHEEAEEVRGLCVHVLRWIVNTERVPRGQPSVPSPTFQAEGGEEGRGRGRASLFSSDGRGAATPSRVRSRTPSPPRSRLRPHPRPRIPFPILSPPRDRRRSRSPQTWTQEEARRRHGRKGYRDEEDDFIAASDVEPETLDDDDDDEGRGRGKESSFSPNESGDVNTSRVRERTPSPSPSRVHRRPRTPSPFPSQSRVRRRSRSPDARTQEARRRHGRKGYRDGDVYRPDDVCRPGQEGGGRGRSDRRGVAGRLGNHVLHY